MSANKCELSLNTLRDLRADVASAMQFDLSDSQKKKFTEILYSIDTLIRQQKPLKHNCNVCVHPWRKDKDVALCYVRNGDDEYHEHALVVEHPELHTCSNFRSSRKTASFCKYEWSCAFRKTTPEGNKCTNNVYCPQQVRKPEKIKKI